jgi:hypothetical protein
MGGGITHPFPGPMHWTNWTNGPGAAVGKPADMGGGVPTITDAMRFAAALKLARQELGGFNNKPYNMAIGADTAQANIASAAATKQAHQVEDDVAALYGRVGNFVKGTAQAGRQGTKQTINQMGNTGKSTDAAIRNIYNSSNQQSSAYANSLGMSGSPAAQANPNSPSATDERFLRGSVASNTGGSQNATREGGDAFNKLMAMTRGDTMATGAADVASEKSSLNQTLATIKSALSSQLAAVHVAQAQALAAHQTAVHQAATAAIAAANNPMTKLDEAYKAAEIQKMQNANSNTSKTATSTYEKAANASISGLKGTDAKNAATLFGEAISGQLPGFTGVKVGTTTETGATKATLPQIDKIIQAAGGLSPLAKQDLINALSIYAGL